MWYWFDKIRFIVIETAKDNTIFTYKDKEFLVKTSTDREIDFTWNLLADYCYELSETEKLEFIENLACKLEVDISIIPDSWKPVSWDCLKELSENNIEIGSHTLSHPVLTKLDSFSLKEEIVASKTVIEEKTGAGVKTFAYPFGGKSDYNQDIIRMVENSGYDGAVTAHGGINHFNDRYVITRMSVSNDKVDFLWQLYGLEYLMMKLKGFIQCI